MRELATVREIREIREIPKADFIELILIDGWQCVSQKGTFKVGDKCVYFEIDSILPPEDWCEFMAVRKYRVKTIKLQKQLSQGLALPLDVVGIGSGVKIGADVTKHLGVTKHDPEGDKERKANANNKRKVIPMRWLLRCGTWGGKLHRLLYPRASGSWPKFDTWSFPKTDETRVQNMNNLPRSLSGRLLYATEKLDGQSASFFYHRKEKAGLLKRGLFGVCSKNIWYKIEIPCNWWNIAKQERLDKMLPEYCENTGQSLCIQGEIIGEGIQSNPYVLKGKEFYVFSVYDLENGRYLTDIEKGDILHQLQLMNVPRLSDAIVRLPNWDAEDFLDNAEGKSLLNLDVEREGVVWRDVTDDSFSFKAISNKFLLKGGRN